LMKFIELLKEEGLIGTDGKVTKKIGILIKLNQNGFLTTGINDPSEGYLGTLEVIRLAKSYGIEVIVSHRSKEAGAEENEVSIAELAAAVDAYALKSGDHVQATRAVKEDRLAAIDAIERTRAAASISLTKTSRRQQVDTKDQIIAVPASEVIANKAGFEDWIENQAENVAVVIIAMADEYEGVKQYEDIAYLRVVGRDINEGHRLLLTEMFGSYGSDKFFGGFELGTPYSLDKYKSVVNEIASGV